MDIEAASEIASECASGYGNVYDLHIDTTWLMLKLQEEVGELAQAHLDITGRSRPRGKSADELRRALEDELADVLGMTLNIATHHDVDIVAAFDRKWGSHVRNREAAASGDADGQTR